MTPETPALNPSVQTCPQPAVPTVQDAANESPTPLDAPMSLAVGKGVDPALTVFPARWPKVVENLLKQPKRAPTTMEQYAALPKDARDAEKSRSGYVVPASFAALTEPDDKGAYRAYRAKVNVERVFALKLDIELDTKGAARLAADPDAPKGNASVEDIIGALQGFEMVLHETRSSKPDDRRHRCYVLLQEGGMEPDDAHTVGHYLCDRLEAAGIAVDRASSTDFSKPAFLPTLSADQQWSARHVPGRPVGIDDVPEGYEPPTRLAPSVQVPVPTWEPVALDALDLPESVKTRIREGAEAGQPRHQAIFGVCCAMLRAGIDPDSILKVVADPEHGISDKVLDEWGSGDQQRGMAHVAKYIMPAAVEETAVSFQVAEDGKVRTGPPTLLDWLERDRLPYARDRMQKSKQTVNEALPPDEPEGIRDRLKALTKAYAESGDFGFAREWQSGKQDFDLDKAPMKAKVKELADLLAYAQRDERRLVELEGAIEALRVDGDASRVPTHLVGEYQDKFFKEAADHAVAVSEKRDALAEACGDILEQPDILEAAVTDVHRHLGIVGEDTTIKGAYLLMTSRLLPKPNHAKVFGDSASGKSSIVESVQQLMPDGDVIDVTSISTKALYGMDLKHKVLYLGEATILSGDINPELAMILRELLEKQRIRNDKSEQDENGRWQHVTQISEGPVSFITTSTGSMHNENETRVLSLCTDSGSDQTRRVLAKLSEDDDFVALPDDVAAKWHAFQEWLSLGPKEVLSAHILTEVHAELDPSHTRIRRDFKQLKQLTRLNALVNQRNRETDEQGRIVATIDDYAVARELVLDTMAKQQDAVIPERTRVLVMAVYELLEATPATGYVSEPEVKVSQRRLSELTGIPKSAVDRAVADAIDRGFLVNEERVPKRPMRLTKGDVQMSAEDDVSHVLPTPEEIANRMALN